MKISKAQLLESLTLELHRKEKQNILAYIPFILAFIWVVLLFISPALMPPNSIYLGNNGKVSIPDNTPYINAHIHNPVFHAVYISGDYMCHQHADRSFFINGNQMPYCARCTGIFLGLAFGLFLAAYFRVRMGFLLYFLILIPMALDGGIQLITSYESTNLTRIITGMLVGTFSAFVFAYMFYATPSELSAK
ncbi:MAG: DUF2085 domain-containing protein [Euryarchaeota archaeon]|nr:DUF2085 domain-containing protein [Euryarchaeota archaeon]